MTRYGILIVDMEEICIEEQWFPNFRIHSAIAGIEKLINCSLGIIVSLPRLVHLR